MLPATVASPTYPWSRLHNEPIDWYQRFLKYGKPFGIEFTPARAYRLYQHDASRLLIASLESDGLTFWIQIAEQWHWATRAAESADEEQVITDAKWAARRLELLEADWNSASALRQMVAELTEQYVTFIADSFEEREEDAPYKPPVALQSILQTLKMSSELQRLALAMPTDIKETRQTGIALYLPKTEELNGPPIVLEQRSDSVPSNGDNDSGSPSGRELIEETGSGD